MENYVRIGSEGDPSELGGPGINPAFFRPGPATSSCGYARPQMQFLLGPRLAKNTQWVVSKAAVVA